MFKSNEINISEGIYISKTSDLHECKICHHYRCFSKLILLISDLHIKTFMKKTDRIHEKIQKKSIQKCVGENRSKR